METSHFHIMTVLQENSCSVAGDSAGVGNHLIQSQILFPGAQWSPRFSPATEQRGDERAQRSACVLPPAKPDSPHWYLGPTSHTVVGIMEEWVRQDTHSPQGPRHRRAAAAAGLKQDGPGS